MRFGRLAHNSALALILAVYVGLVLWYGQAVPPWEAPDEPEHLHYVHYVARHWQNPSALPSVGIGAVSESHQPPLYYFLSALLTFWAQPPNLDDLRPNPYFTWPGHDAAVAAAIHTPGTESAYTSPSVFATRVARAASLPWGLITVISAFLLARLVTGRAALALLAAGSVAFLPGFVFSSATVTNDAAIMALAGVTALVSMRQKPGATHLELGGLAALLVLCVAAKLSGVLVAVAAVATLAVTGVPLVRCLLVAAPAALLGIGWTLTQGWVALVGHQNWTPALGITPEDVLPGLANMGRSLVGVFGWVNVPFPVWVYLIIAGLGSLAVGGLVRTLASDRLGGGLDPKVVLKLAIWPAIMAAALLLRWTLSGEARIANEHARYLYPVLVPMASLVALGWTGLPRLLGRGVAVATPLGLLVTSVLAMPLVIRPAYAYIDSITSFVSSAPDAEVVRASVLPAPDFRVVGYRLAPDCPKPGNVVRLSLYWQATGPASSSIDTVVLIEGDRWRRTGLSQRNPGGLYSSSSWLPNEVIRDDHHFWLAHDLPDGKYVLEVGVVRFPDVARYPSPEPRIPSGPVEVSPLASFYWSSASAERLCQPS